VIAVFVLAGVALFSGGNLSAGEREDRGNRWVLVTFGLIGLTIRDRVVQTAALLILQPIFEADLEPTAYGYRPGRTALEAVQIVHRALCAGHTEVIYRLHRLYRDRVVLELTPAART
jgi:hypothetical protein